MENKEQWIGECARCESEKHLEYARYGFAICWECEHKIAASLREVKKAFCRVCRKRFSWLWGKYEYDKGFTCLGCTRGATCQKCRTAPAVKLIDSPIGKIWGCSADAGSMDEPPQEYKVDRLY